MESFDELGLRPEIVEALSAEGIEVPTALQLHALPVLRRGNAAVLRASAGAGTLLAYGGALLDTLEGGEGRPGALVLTFSAEQAGRLAASLARVSLRTGHRVGALGVPWALPTHSDILFATPTDAHAAMRAGDLKLDAVRVLVLDGGSALVTEGGAALDAALEATAHDEGHRVLVVERVTPSVREFVEAHMRRAVYLPPEAAADAEPTSHVERGEVRVWTCEEGQGQELARLVAQLLGEGADHLLLFFRSEDRAADLGDLLALHGFASGAPGDGSVPLWLGVDPLEVRERLGEVTSALLVVSVDVPADPDALDRRHRLGQGAGVVLALPRELPHLRRIAAEAGYRVVPFPPAPSKTLDGVESFRAELERAIDEEDLGGALLLLEPLIERYGAAEVAAAATALLRKGQPREAAAPTTPGGHAPPTPFVRLFLSIGSRDGASPGDLVGAITGEAGVDGSQIGRIELRDTFARVEVEESVAARVIRALNGISLKGRSIRADFDRGGR